MLHYNVNFMLLIVILIQIFFLFVPSKNHLLQICLSFFLASKMNFDIGSTSYLSSTSSSDDDDNLVMNNIAEMNATEKILCHAISSRNMILANYLIQQNNEVIHGGSVPSHIVINRDREIANHNLFVDYFAENPRYADNMFCRRYRMSRDLFLRIVNAVKNHDNYFHQRRDALVRLGLSTIQKVTTVFRMLTYGLPTDATDEYIKIGESIAIESMKRFCRAIVEIFAEQYLRTPTANNIARLLYIGKQRGFLGMLGSLDCMHWKWKIYPTAWVGQYASRSGNPTIILEVVADYDLWIWHAYFGMPGTNNDINVLESSNHFSNLAKGIAPPAKYVIKEKEYNMGYYLADSIYPKWATIVQTIHQPQGRKKKYFAMKQEACRKDVERAFGVLQLRFAIVAGPARFLGKKMSYMI